MQEQNIQLAETLGHKSPQTITDLLKVLVASGVDTKEFAKTLLQKAKQHSTLHKSLSPDEQTESLQKAKAYLFLAEAITKAMAIVEADASKGSNLSAPAKQRFQRAHQKCNRNIDPAQSSLGNLLGKSREITAGDMARCSRYCKDEKGRDVQGRSSCPVCLGAGHSKARLVST
jgi:hypothetical protein